MFCSIICAYKVTLSSNKTKHICSGSQTLHCTLAKYPEIKTNSNQVSQRWYVFSAFIVILCCPDYYTNCTGGTLGFRSRGWSNVFLGLKFSIPGFFLGRQIWQVYDFLWEGEGGWVFKTIWRFAVMPAYFWEWSTTRLVEAGKVGMGSWSRNFWVLFFVF